MSTKVNNKRDARGGPAAGANAARQRESPLPAARDAVEGHESDASDPAHAAATIIPLEEQCTVVDAKYFIGIYCKMRMYEERFGPEDSFGTAGLVVADAMAYCDAFLPYKGDAREAEANEEWVRRVRETVPGEFVMDFINMGRAVTNMVTDAQAKILLEHKKTWDEINDMTKAEASEYIKNLPPRSPKFVMKKAKFVLGPAAVTAGARVFKTPGSPGKGK